MATSNRTFECVLQGEISINDYKNFLNRVDGLANDNCIQEKFGYKEFVYNFDSKSPQYIQGVNPIELRARQILRGSSLFTGQVVEKSTSNTQQWEMRYIGKWERKRVQDQQTGVLAEAVPFRNQTSVSVSENVREFFATLGLRHSFRYMKVGTRWQFLNGVIVEASKIKELANNDVNDTYRLVDLENLQVNAMLLEIRCLTPDEKIDEVAQIIRRFSVDLKPYFIERDVVKREISHSTATLAAESSRKRQRS